MEMENQLKSIVYLTVNTVNNKIYVGIHITENPYKFDGYYGCGITGTNCYHFLHPKTPFQRACKKYGLNAFKRYTLFVFDTYELAQEMERKIVNEDFVKRPDTYNVALGDGTELAPEVEIEVHKYDLEGNYVASYRSKSDAARKHDCSFNTIQSAILNKGICRGFYWSETKVCKLIVEDRAKVQNKKVHIYNLNGEYVQSFNSISDFAKFVEVNKSSVDRAIKNFTKCGGYYVSFEKTGKIVIPTKKIIRHKTICKYDLNGKFIEEISMENAKILYGKDHKKIYNAIKEHYSCCGFLWSYDKVDQITPLQKTKNKKIYQYDLEGNLIKIWNSYRECNKEFSKLREVLNGVRNHIKGYTFKYELIEGDSLNNEVTH